MGTAYDSNVLQQYADDLYGQAKWIVIWTAVRYGAVVFLVTFAVFVFIGSQQKNLDPNVGNTFLVFIGIFTAAGIAVGVDAGRRKGFNLKLQAQTLLCQRQIELNTKK